MIGRTRRDFLADVGRGMLVASLGTGSAMQLGLTSARADDEPSQLNFGPLEPLVGLMQDTPPDQLMEILAKRIAEGTELKTLVAAGALANARTFGGQDYTGYHALMALAPSYDMAKELPVDKKALPVLKVLYRNTNRMIEQGGRKKEVLKPVNCRRDPSPANGEMLRDATRKADEEAAEQVFAQLMQGPRGEAYNHLQMAVQDEVDVHRVVLAWRAWVLLDFTGPDQAQTLLRQSVRFCVQAEKIRKENNVPVSGVRTTLPKLLDQYKLLSRPMGDRQPDDAWVQKLSQTICNSKREEAAEAVAAALAEGFDPNAIGEAMSLAAALLVLRDPGRNQDEAGKPKGSVHGASVGVHASDSANAWRNIARVCNQRNAIASLIVGGYHTAGQTRGLNPQPIPPAAIIDAVRENDADAILRSLETSVKEKDQPRACALVQKYAALGYPAKPVFDTLLRFAVSEDGALHAEKYYRTVCEEFATTRPVFRWQHLTALARVTASEYGFPAPGYQAACRLLKV